MKWIYSLYALAALGVLLSFDVFWEYESVHIISKSLLVPILIVAVLLSGPINPHRRLLIAALVFCSCGDVFLLFQEEELYFMLGLGAFLSAHILYAMLFRKTVDHSHNIPILMRIKLWTFLFIILGAAMFLYLRPDLGEMEIPVLLYTIAIIIMAMMAFNRHGRADNSNFWLVFGGAMLFMASDTIIGIDKFKDPFPCANYWIMVLYMLSQWMIVKGVLKHEGASAKAVG